MFSHVTIGTNDLARAIPFYDAILAPLGIERAPGKFPGWASWKRPGQAGEHTIEGLNATKLVTFPKTRDDP